VEVFVAGEAQEAAIGVGHPRHAGLREFASLAQQARARAMLEAPVAFAHGRDLEQIAIERCRAVPAAAEEVAMPLADPREIAPQAIEIRALPAAHRDLVRRAAGDERREGEIAHLDGVVDQFVVVRGVIATESGLRRRIARQRGGHAPVAADRAFGGGDVDLAAPVGPSVGAEIQARPVEVAARGVEDAVRTDRSKA
jgi:hypothetical protein